MAALIGELTPYARLPTPRMVDRMPQVSTDGAGNSALVHDALVHELMEARDEKKLLRFQKHPPRPRLGICPVNRPGEQCGLAVEPQWANAFTVLKPQIMVARLVAQFYVIENMENTAVRLCPPPPKNLWPPRSRKTTNGLVGAVRVYAADVS